VGSDLASMNWIGWKTRSRAESKVPVALVIARDRRSIRASRMSSSGWPVAVQASASPDEVGL
jgi:hypothetical protein